MANIVITDAKLTPNPVVAKGSFILSVGVREVVYALMTLDSSYLKTLENRLLEKIPKGE